MNFVFNNIMVGAIISYSNVTDMTKYITEILKQMMYNIG